MLSGDTVNCEKVTGINCRGVNDHAWQEWKTDGPDEVREFHLFVSHSYPHIKIWLALESRERCGDSKLQPSSKAA